MGAIPVLACLRTDYQIRMGLDENAILYTDKLWFEVSTPFNASAPFA